MDHPKTAVIIGAGPAGLTAAHELLAHTDVHPIVLEKSRSLGGISKTVVHNGNRIDIGGHRFFSKADRVMRWWLDVLPLQATTEPGAARITYQRSSRDVATTAAGPDPETTDAVMLLRQRRSRIYYLRQFFDYPISLSPDTLLKLGLWRTLRIGLSYVRSVLMPIRSPRNLEEFFISRFGRELYLTFFKSYTEKVWGTSCREISAEWGAQRIKGLSITKAVLHFFKKLLPARRDLAQKDTETSLIEQFLYPKFGPGQMWETVAQRIETRGGEVLLGWSVDRLVVEGGRVRAVEAVSAQGERRSFPADWVFSSMPVQELVRSLGEEVPAEVAAVAAGLVYRDFITVGLLVDELAIHENDGSPIRDNWIYVQEPDVQVGRLQIFNNWSPYMVADKGKTWLGLEYFCNEGDELWTLSDEAMIELGKSELDHIGIIDRTKVRDGVVLRVAKTYPAYFGTYDRFEVIRRWVDGFENLFLVGRNGMHKYNNQDHSMLTAMIAVENVAAGRTDKSNVWAVNVEEEYHEEK